MVKRKVVKVRAHKRRYKGRIVWVMPHGRVLKVSKHRMGTSKIARDQIYLALPSGKRESRYGNVYYEYRKNRSDVGLV